MPNDDIAVQPTAWRPATFHRRASWLYDGDKVIHDSVRDRLVENPLVSKPLQVHLQTLQFDAHFIWHIGEHNGAVVGLSRFGAKPK